MNQDARNTKPTALELAAQFETEIKKTAADKFSLTAKELQILDEDENGVYFSQKEPDTFCALVICIDNGRIYLVAAQVVDNGLQNFRCSNIA